MCDNDGAVSESVSVYLSGVVSVYLSVVSVYTQREELHVTWELMEKLCPGA